MAIDNDLFVSRRWSDFEDGLWRNLHDAIERMDGNQLLNTSVGDLAEYYEERFEVTIPTIERDGIVTDQRECQVDVSRDPYRAIRDRSRPFMLSGTTIDVEVPFSGDSVAFELRPSTYSLRPPSARVGANKLHLEFSGTERKAAEVRAEIDLVLDSIESSLTHLRNSAAAFNAKLKATATSSIEKRRSKLLADQDLVAGLGFPIRERENSKRTYAAPEVRRKLPPKAPSASSTPFKPEPILGDAEYEHILGVVQNMAQVMEYSPNAFLEMKEEDLRMHFLVQLNGHYKGKATGETFNYEGKTDILIRSDGKNIFIAECKFWTGKKGLQETIDQVLGYVSWRDTKVALILFNRNKNFSNVLASIPGEMEAHSNFKSGLPKSTETVFRYRYSHRDDPNREMSMTVLAFNVPKSEKSK